MKTLKIYNIIATIMIIALAFWAMYLQKELRETNALLEQCSTRYYQEVSK